MDLGGFGLRRGIRAGLAGLAALIAVGVTGAFVTAAAQHASPATPGPTASGSVPAPGADLLTPGRLVICSSFPRVRFAERAADGSPFGVDIDIGTGIAAVLGLEPDVRELPFDTLIDAVVGRQCDVSIAGQFITAARLERIAMIAYRGGTPHVIVRAGNPLAIDELLDLCGRTLAIVSGTVYVDMVSGVGEYAGSGLDQQCLEAGLPSIDQQEHPTQADAEAALAGDQAQAYIGNDFVTVDRPEQFALSVELLPTRNGIGHRIDAPSLDVMCQPPSTSRVHSILTLQDALRARGCPSASGEPANRAAPDAPWVCAQACAGTRVSVDAHPERRPGPEGRGLVGQPSVDGWDGAPRSGGAG